MTKTIPSKTGKLLEVREFVASEARAFGFSDEDISKIALAVDEACTNIIRHAYQNDPNRAISITIQKKRDRFEVSIVDDGKKFDPAVLKPLNLKEHLTQYRRGGLGVYLMKTLMDKVEYNTLGDKKNEVRLTKFLHPVRARQ
ncbi:MAG: ATP-binding protein [Ignavibacteriales bacterium]|nr:ATP-binding protein [Ignavibacteriales bacterium]